MRSALVSLILSAAVIFAGACSGANDGVAPGVTASPDAGTPDAGGDRPLAGRLPCDVDKVLADNCRKCHAAAPVFGAPMPLATWADLHAPAPSDAARKVHQLVPERINDDVNPMPQKPNARLSAADRAVLASWSAAGAPQGTTDCNTKPPVDPPTIACKPDVSIGPSSEWNMDDSTGGDEYVCYGVEMPTATAKHVTGFAPRIDNKNIVHHVVLYEADKEFPSTPTKCSPSGSLQWRMVTGWAPGGKGFELPAHVGFPLKTSPAVTHYVVQMHYSNPLAKPGQRDKSGFDLCTGVPQNGDQEADVLAFGTQQINLPQGAKVETKCSITVPQQLAGIHLVASMPHMHILGTDMSTRLLAGGAGGAASDLGTIAGWSFNTQAWLEIKSPDGNPGGIVTTTNDVIQTTCAWKNTTTSAVKFGENTADEMCYSFTVYYPRINSGLWTWAGPALASQCTTITN